MREDLPGDATKEVEGSVPGALGGEASAAEEGGVPWSRKRDGIHGGLQTGSSPLVRVPATWGVSLRITLAFVATSRDWHGRRGVSRKPWPVSSLLAQRTWSSNSETPGRWLSSLSLTRTPIPGGRHLQTR